MPSATTDVAAMPERMEALPVTIESGHLQQRQEAVQSTNDRASPAAHAGAPWRSITFVVRGHLYFEA